LLHPPGPFSQERRRNQKNDRNNGPSILGESLPRFGGGLREAKDKMEWLWD